MELDAIFKAYDIRGLSPEQLNPDAARAIGVGFAEFANAPAIAVGHDCRLTSPGLSDAIIEGITSRGTDVVYLGEITTDMLYFYSGAHDVPGLVITASHNPPEYNGIKICLSGAAPVGEDTGLQEIKAIALSHGAAEGQPGSVSEHDALAGYVDHLFSIVDVGAFVPMRVAIDGGNGMAGVAVPEVFGRTPAEIIGLYLEPDGTFPNHPADPLRPENLVDLQALMEKEKPAFGIAFDGDADRAFFVDDQGVALPGSTTTAVIASWFLAREPGAKIVHNLICSKAVPETVRAAGGEPIRTRVGHSYIKQVMKETGAVFGGEHSAHFYFRDNYRADSGILASLVLMQIMSEDGRPLSEIRKDYEPYAQSGEVNFTVAAKDEAMAAVEVALAPGVADRLDGLTMDMGDRWLNLRASNTEPVLRLNVEAPSDGDVAAIVDKVASILANY
ncbi:MAG: phosphomannomutase/phosphoglucomutase [Acidimicrobiia bacterium]|nr:phosphomannomutase/phosphoglucomutase [Acidimicrobiia bacterium]